MRKTRIVLSFDDGREDNYNAFMDILYPRRLPASIFIATGYIEGKCGLGANQKTQPLTLSQIEAIDKCDLFEVAAHGNMHCNRFDDILEGKQILMKWLGRPLSSTVGFASPGSMMSNQFVIEHEKEILEIGLDYIRTGSNFQGMARANSRFLRLIRRICRVLLSRYNNRFLYYLSYGDSYIKHNDNSKVLTSFPVLHETSLDSLKLIVRQAIKHKRDAIFMFHSIKKQTDIDYYQTWSWDYQQMVQFCDFLCYLRDKEEIEIVRLKDLTNNSRGIQ